MTGLLKKKWGKKRTKMSAVQPQQCTTDIDTVVLDFVGQMFHLKERWPFLVTLTTQSACVVAKLL